MSIKQNIVILLLIPLAIAWSTGQAAAQTTIYFDDFDGTGGLLDGATEDKQGTLWSANSAFLDDGNLDEANEGSAILPFSPVINATYELSLDISNTTDRWVGLGFKDSALTSAGASTFADRFSNGGGRSWLLYRDHATDPTQDIQLFAGPNVVGGIADDDVAISSFAQFNSFKIVLDTTGDGSSYTVDYQLDQGSGFSTISSGPQLVSENLSTLSFVGLTFDNATATDVMFDDFLLTEQITGVVPNEWAVDGGGLFSTNGNWTMGTPMPGSTALFGNALSAANSPAEVTLDSAVSLAEVQFNNVGASYNLAGPSTLNLVGGAAVNGIAGNHEVSAVIGGAAGLVKTGGGTVVLSANNTYTGTTDVQAGALQIQTLDAVDGSVSVAAGAAFGFVGDGAGGGASGTFANAISGAGEVVLDSSLTSETITFSNAKVYTGQTTIVGGTLEVSGAGSLGSSDGTAASGTLIGGNENTAKLSLPSANVGNEVIRLGARELSALDAVHITSSGSSTVPGNIKGELGGTNYNIESTSGTLTLGGTISAPDTSPRNYVFSGAGNTRINGRLVDVQTDADGVVATDEFGDPVNDLNNVNVVKRGGGTLTINTLTDLNDDYWRGTTTIEEGTLEVLADANNGELRSTVTVRSGATFDVDSFGTYNLLPLATIEAGIGGGGTVQGNLGIFEATTVTPGDSVGTLTINGSASFTYFDATEAVVPNSGSLNFELGSNPAIVGGAENDLIDVNGQVTINSNNIGSNQWQVNVTPVAGTLGGGSNYTLIDGNSLSTPSTTSGSFQVNLLDAQGNAMTTRQTASVVINSGAGNVELDVNGAAANLTWSGSVNSNWDKNTTANFTGSTFFDLDNVNFLSGAPNKSVIVNTNVAPGTVNFDSGVGNTYTLSGSGGLTGTGPVNVNSGTVVFENTGNAYAGTTTVASGARLETRSGTTGTVNVSGTLAVRGNASITIVDDFNTPGLGEYTFSKVLDQGTATNVSFFDTAGTIDVVSTGADGAEQTLLLRGDFTLQQGEELQLDAPTVFNDRDLGIAIGEAHGDLGNGSSGDNRSTADYLFMAWRNLGQLNSRGFNGNAEVPLQQAFGVNAETLFIARLADDTIELGWYEGGVRNVSWSAAPTTTDIFDNVGFYADVRADGNGFSGADDLRIVSGEADSVLNIEGDLMLAGGGTLEFDISSLGFTSAEVSGIADLSGSVAVNLLDGFMPAAGAEYDLLSAVGGIFDSGLSFDLPALGGGLSWDTSAFVSDGVLSILGSVADADGDGDVDGADFLLLQRTNPAAFPQWQAVYAGGAALTADLSAATVPEPSFAVLAFCAAFTSLGFRRAVQTRKEGRV